MTTAERELSETVAAFKCDKTWDSLRETSNSVVRFCDECQCDVHWCSTNAQLAENVALNRCIAIEVNDFSAELIGRVIPP